MLADVQPDVHVYLSTSLCNGCSAQHDVTCHLAWHTCCDHSADSELSVLIAAEALEKLKSQGKITLSPDHSTRLRERIAAKTASAKSQAKNSTAIGRIRYEGALERALS